MNARLPRLGVTAASLCVAGLVAWGCRSEDRGFGDDLPAFDRDAGADAMVVPPECATRCSLDLHAVVTGCEGTMVTTCGEGQGCASNACVTACDAAKAAQGSRGCSFMTVPPAQLDGSTGSCFAAFVANTWNEPADISLFYRGQQQDITASLVVANPGERITYAPLGGPLPPGGVAILFLAQSPFDPRQSNFIACPAEPVIKESGSLKGTGRLEAFEIRASVPITSYSIFPYGGSASFLPSATLLLPQASWGTGYRMLDAWAASSLDLAPSVQVVAAEDDTEVRVVPSSPIHAGKGVEASPANAEAVWKLRRGEAVQIVQADRLLGSPLTSNKPVAVFGGANCMFLPETQKACDSLQQQIPPQSAWGTEYAAVRYRARTGDDGELVPWRIVAAANGTTLTYDPEPPQGAPTQMGAGESATFWSGSPFSVVSQDREHPIFMNGYMTGGVAFNGVGDPDFVNVVPSDQFLGEYVFFSDHTYAEGTVTLVRRRTALGFHDVTLDCAGVVEGWKPIGHAGQLEFARVDLVRGGNPQVYAGGTCGHGRHEARSAGPFGLTVWGFDLYASYAYPGGSGTRALNDAPVR